MNNLPMKPPKSFWHRIRNFFSRIFGIEFKKKETIEVNTVDSEKINGRHEDDFRKELQKEVEVTNKKKYIIEQIKENPQMIDNLPLERLENLEKLYDEAIMKNEEEIKRLTDKIQKLKAEIDVN